MNSLFDLSSNYQRIMDVIMENDVLSEEVLKELELLSDSLEEKLLNYASIIKTIEAKADAIKAATEKMLKRYDSLEKSAERLKETVKQEMLKCNKKNIENDYHELNIKFNNPKVNVVDQTIIPQQYFRKIVKEVTEINKSLIAKSLKDNIVIPGVSLVRDCRLEII